MKRTALIFSMVILVFAFSVISHAKEGVVKGSYINVRENHDFGSPVIAKKLRGTKYTVNFEEKGWVKATFEDGTVGWIYESLLEKSKFFEASPVQKPAQGSDSAALSTDSSPNGKKEATGSAGVSVPPVQTGPVSMGESNPPDSAISNPEPGPQGTEPGKQPPETTGKQEPAASKKTEMTNPPSKEPKEAKVPETKPNENPAKEAKGKSGEKSRDTQEKAGKPSAEPSKDAKQKSKKGETKIARIDEERPLEDFEAGEEEIPAPPKGISTSKSAEEFYNEAIELFEKRRYPEALEANRQAIKQAPRNFEILNNLGNCLFKLGKVDEALSTWKEALEVSPKSAKVCNNLGIAFYQKDENEKAIEFYKKAILFDPQFPDPYYNLASVFGFKSQFKDAIENYQKYLGFTLDPTMKQLTEERIEYCKKQMATQPKTTGKSTRK